VKDPVKPSDANRFEVGILSFLKDRDSRTVNFLAGLSLAVAVLVKVIFANTRNSIPGAANLGNLGADICVGYIVAWIVYYLVSWRPRRQDRNRAVRQVGGTAIGVGGNAESLLHQLRQVSNDPTSGPIQQEKLASLVGQLTTDDQSKMVGPDLHQRIPISDMLWYHLMHAEDLIGRCMRLSLYLDSQLVTALAQISDCSFFRTLRLLRGMPVTQSLFNLVPDIYQYFLLSDALKSLVVCEYGSLLDGVNGISIQAVSETRASDGPLIWRPGQVSPWTQSAGPSAS
jgi:hypothetical protein